MNSQKKPKAGKPDVTVLLHGSAGLTPTEAQNLEIPLSRFSNRLRRAADQRRKNSTPTQKVQ